MRKSAILEEITKQYIYNWIEIGNIYIYIISLNTKRLNFPMKRPMVELAQ